MRQTALICLLAYCGSFVPASGAVWARSIASSPASAPPTTSPGRSTFMVEMTETANILHNATPRAWCCSTRSAAAPAPTTGWRWRGPCRTPGPKAALTLFATHYFELTNSDLTPATCQRASEATEHAGDIVFLYRVEAGPASQSYGIQVAKLAGVPRGAAPARERLASLERGTSNTPQGDLFASAPEPVVSEAEGAALDRLANLDPDALTPREAHAALYELVELLDRDR